MAIKQKTLLSRSARFLASNGFTLVTLVDDSIEDKGKTHALLEYQGEEFSLRAKEYRYKGKASFGLEQVEQASRDGHTLLSYIKKQDSFFVFDAAHVEAKGHVYEQPSKESVSREWIEVDGDDGVELSEYVKGEATPRTLDDDKSNLSYFS